MQAVKNHKIWIAALVCWMLLPWSAGCNRQTKHRILTVLFTGVPPLEEEQAEPPVNEQVQTKPVAAVPASKSKTAAPLYYTHNSYAGGRCDQCHMTSASLSFRLSGSKEGPDGTGNGSVGAGRLKLPLQKLCIRCHRQKSAARAADDGLWLHGPAAQGNCIFCHDPHKSSIRYLLNDPSAKLCTRCHLENSMMPDNFHKESEDCLECHNPHLGEDRLMLTEDYQEPKSPNSDLPDLAGVQAGSERK